MNKRYVIVGGGLAGATCAYMLAQAGREVTVIERKKASDKSKLCGGLMTPRSMELASTIYARQDIESLYRRTFTQMLCITERQQALLTNVLLRSVCRKELDDLALESFSKLGGQVIDQCDVKDVDFTDKLVIASDKDHNDKLICYDVLIAADGALSTVRKLQTGLPPLAVLSLEAEVHAPVGKPLTMLYDSSLHGYCWYIPRGEGTGSSANIGCVSYGGKEADLDEHLKRFSQQMETPYRTRRGAFIPTGSDILLEQDGVYYLGDASGLICPPTGEGIYYALLTAERLFQTLTCGLDYQKLMRPYAREVARQYKMRDMFFSKRFMDTALAAAEHTPYGSERAIRFALKHFASF